MARLRGKRAQRALAMCRGTGALDKGVGEAKPKTSEVQNISDLGKHGWASSSHELYFDTEQCSGPPSAENSARGSPVTRRTECSTVSNAPLDDYAVACEVVVENTFLNMRPAGQKSQMRSLSAPPHLSQALAPRMPVDPPAPKQTEPEQWGNISDQEQWSDISDQVFQQWSNLDFPEQAFCEEAPITPERKIHYQQEAKEAKEVGPQAQKQSLPLPSRGLHSRLRPHTRSAPPTWSAWLPKALQQVERQPTQRMPGASAPVPFAEDAPPTMLSNTNCSSQDACDGSAYQSIAWVSMDGVTFEPVVFQSGPDAGNNACGYYTEEQLEQQCTQYDGQDAYTYYMGTQMEQEYAQSDELLPEDCFTFEQTIGHVWKLARDAHGSRQVQNAFENGSDAERMALTSELKGRVWEALKCQHANHALQKCISTISPLAAQFVIDELSQRGGGVAQAARHRFGCRVIERLLEHCGAEQVSPMVEEFLADVASLSSHTYGNYVVQHLLEHCGDDVVSRITSILDQHVSTMPKMAADGFIGGVIAKALGRANNQGSRSLATTLLQDPERSAVMACSRWGHHAVKQALQLTDDLTRNKACAELHWRSQRLNFSRYGRQVAHFAGKHQSLQATLSN